MNRIQSAIKGSHPNLLFIPPMTGISIDNYLLFEIFLKVKDVLYNILTIFDFWSMYAGIDLDKNDKAKEEVMSTPLKIYRR